MEMFVFPEMALTRVFLCQHLLWRTEITIAFLAHVLSIQPKRWEDAVFPRGMVVSWQGDCFRSGRKAVWCVGGITSTDRLLFRFVGRAAPHHGPALWAQGQVSFGTTAGFCWLKVYEIICISQANSWFRESLLVVGTAIPAAPCCVWFPCWHWCLCSVFL